MDFQPVKASDKEIIDKLIECSKAGVRVEMRV